MMKKAILYGTAKICICLMLLLMLALHAQAMGVGPSRQELTFEPGKHIEDELLLINQEKSDMRVTIYAEGELSNYITIPTPLMDISSSDYVKLIPYEIDFPQNPPKPGPHKIDLVIRQLPKEGDSGQTSVSTSMALKSNIILKVPYPGKYAEAKLYIANEEDAESPIDFNMVLYNFGTDDIGEAHARIEVKGPLLGKIAEFNTDTVAIDSKEEKKIATSWMPTVNRGTYKAVATVYYDDKKLILEQNFDIGAFVIDVADISVDKFRLGDVAKFDILLDNNWNTQIDDVYAELSIEDSGGREVTKFKTAAVDIPPHEAGKLEAYWYTEGSMPGIYNVDLMIHYNDKIAHKEYTFEVNTNSITQLGAVGQAILADGEQEGVTTQGLLIILILAVIVLLLVMNGVWFYYIVKKLKDKGEDK